MLPNDHHPGPRCACDDCLRMYREEMHRADQAEPKPPYPFCCHKDKCIPAGRCMRTVGGEPWSCAD